MTRETGRKVKKYQANADVSIHLTHVLGNLQVAMLHVYNTYYYLESVKTWFSFPLQSVVWLMDERSFPAPWNRCPPCGCLEKTFGCITRGILWGSDVEVFLAHLSLYNCSSVHIASNKLDSFLVGVGLGQGFPLSPSVFIIFMDRVSKQSQSAEGFHLGGLRIVNDVVHQLVASNLRWSSLQPGMEWWVPLALRSWSSDERGWSAPCGSGTNCIPECRMVGTFP